MPVSNSHQRKQIIIKEVISRRSVDVKNLSMELGVTQATIRNDLNNLEKRGLVIRTHGGAVAPEDESLARNFFNTINEQTKEKENIAKEAAKLVHDGDTIIIDAGSTNAILAKYIQDKKITVLTNSLPVIQELINCQDIEIIVIGGIIRRASFSFIGSFGKSILESFNVDTYFMGATSFDVNKGISNSNIVEGQTKQLMLDSAQKVCFIADSSKGDKSSLYNICDWNRINVFITDTLDEKTKKKFTEKYKIKVKTLND